MDGIRNVLNVSRKKSSVIDKLIYQNKICRSNKDKSNALNNFFVNIGASIESKIPNGKNNFSEYLNTPNVNSIFLKKCELHEIISIISNLQISKSCGPNSIPSNLLKLASDVLAPIIMLLINESFDEGTFPDLLKIANVCPIFKKNEVYDCKNYRPISLLSNISKIFEKLMYNRVHDFLETFDIIYKYQFGFREKYSTTHALLSMVETIRSNLDNKLFSCGVFVDLEKAFDTVNHNILIKS